jgi:HK97 family phage prohead protease
MEQATPLKLELKDLDTNKRTALIKHSVYNSIDKVGDVSHKGMCAKSWQEGKPAFYINHDANRIPGHTTRTFDDDSAGYTEVKFGNWTLGNDALEMADSGIFTGASFGYATIKKDYGEMKGKKVRHLREVKHYETSLLTVEAAHPEAGLISLIKSIEESTGISELLICGDEHLTALKSYIQKIEAYCRDAKASDETIINLSNSLKEYKQLISDYDTAITQLATEPVASDEEMEQVNHFLTTLKIQTWKRQSLNNWQT